jgi:hypothetical protein
MKRKIKNRKVKYIVIYKMFTAHFDRSFKDFGKTWFCHYCNKELRKSKMYEHRHINGVPFFLCRKCRKEQLYFLCKECRFWYHKSDLSNCCNQTCVYCSGEEICF